MTKEAVLEKHGHALSSGQIHITAASALEAMDEYAKQQRLELLQFLAMNMVVCGHYSSPDGQLFKYKGQLILWQHIDNQFIESQNNK